MISEIIVSLSDLGKSVVELIKSHADKKKEEEDKFKTFILYVRHLKYYKLEKQDRKDIAVHLNKIGDYIKTYYDSELSNFFSSSLVEIYWALRYNSDISDPMVETALKPFIKELKKRKFNVR